MNFQLALIKRRGRFGTVWLAAHHPTKISKTEIVHINIAKKCHEIIEYIVNGKENRPKFSLVISSHLMLGLCVLVKKQSQYLLDDLMHLKQEIHKCYINEKLVVKKPKETAKKTPAKTPNKRAIHAERTTITLKENLPLLVTNLETFYEQENERLRDALEETIEKLSVSKPQAAISLVEENLDAISAVQTEDFQFEGGLLLVPENLQDTFFNIENLEKTKLTSTVKFDQRIQPRIPFKELSTNEQVRRAELTATMAHEQETDIYADLESLLAKQPADIENIPPSGPPQIPTELPELYQETFVEPIAPEPLVEQTIQAQTEQSDVSEIQIEAEIQAPMLRPRRIKKEKKRGLVIDEITEFTSSELSKRIRREAEQKYLVELFDKNRLEMKLNFDYLRKDLLKETNNLMMRNTGRIYSAQDSTKYVKNILIRPNMTSAKLLDDKFDYVSEAKQLESIVSVEMEGERQIGESLERGRKRQSTSRVHGDSVQIASKLRRSKDAGFESNLQFEESNTAQFQEQIQEHIQLEVPSLFPPEEPPLISIRPPSLEKAIDVDDFERILIDEIKNRESSFRKVVLQNIIRETDLKKFCVTNRRKFAIKMFQQVLTMCKDFSLKSEQVQTYGDIYLHLV